MGVAGGESISKSIMSGGCGLLFDGVMIVMFVPVPHLSGMWYVSLVLLAQV